MKKLIEFFARNHLFSTIFTVMILLIGLNSTLSIKKELLPELDLPVVTITTVYPGASVEDVELNVTNKIETKLKDISGISEVSSISIENMSQITASIDDTLSETGRNDTVQEIRDAVSSIGDLPNDIDGVPAVQKRKTTDRPVLIAGISSDSLSYSQLRYQAKILEKRLKRVPGVTRIDKIGYLAREVKIELDQDKVKQYELDVQELISAIQMRNVRGTAGSVNNQQCAQDIVTQSQFDEPVEVEDVIVRSSLQGPLIRVKDFAVIKDDYEAETLRARINGQPVIALNIYKRENADIITTVEAIKSALDVEIKNLPEGNKIIYANDVSRYVTESYSVLRSNGIIGFILVLLILTLFLNFRISIWVAFGIPVSLFGSITILGALGYSLNVISLSALILVLGIVVDDAIIISESIYSRYEKGDSPVDAAINGTMSVLAPVVTSLLTTIVAFSPLFFIAGNLGAFIFVIPLVVVTTLSISIAEGIIALPSHIASSLPPRDAKGLKAPFSFEKIRQVYQSFLEVVLRFRKLVTVGFVLIFLGIMFLSGRFNRIIPFPEETAESMTINIELSPGCGLDKTTGVMEQVDKLLLDLPEEEILSFVSTIGKLDQDLMRENTGTVRINLSSVSKRERTAPEIADFLREKVNQIEGIERSEFKIQAAGPAAPKTLSYKIVGTDDEVRKRTADAIYAMLETDQGVIDLERDDKLGKKQLRLDFDYDRMARFAVDVSDVLRELRIAFDGEVVTRVQYGDEEVDFKLISRQDTFEDMNYIQNFGVSNQLGKVVQLSSFAEYAVVDSLEAQRHFNNERTITISANVNRRFTQPGQVNTKVRELFNNTEQPETQLIVKGEEETSRESTTAFTRTFLTALFGIFLLLILLFKSVWKPFIVVSAIPFGIAGALLVFMIHQQPITFMALMGIIGLTGVVVNDSLVMVDRLNKEDYPFGDWKTVRILIAKASSERFRAVILTTLTTAVGVLPLAYGIGGDDPTNAPMALVLGWGLVAATVVTLILLPCVYYFNIRLSYVINSFKSRFSRKS
jgi:multidrug efflux pump subunit AcrB